MRFASHTALIATALFALRSQALPRPATPSYSVVAVDGGQESNDAATTVLKTVTDSKSSPTTVSVTIEETHTPATTTVLSTQQAPTPPPRTITVNGEVSTVYPPAVVIPGSRTSYTTTAIVSETTTVLESEQTTVFQQAATTTVVSLVTPSTSYFDNGMWHTSYGVPVWPTKNVVQKHYNQTTPRTTSGAIVTGR